MNRALTAAFRRKMAERREWAESETRESYRAALDLRRAATLHPEDCVARGWHAPALPVPPLLGLLGDRFVVYCADCAAVISESFYRRSVP